MIHRTIIFFVLLLGLIFEQCRCGGASEPVSSTSADTSTVKIAEFKDTVGTTNTPPAIKTIKCNQIDKSPFKSLGCCADLCPDSLRLKPQDCCCEDVIMGYEKLYSDYVQSKNDKPLKKIQNDFILNKCKRRYKSRFVAIEEKYKPKPANPYD